MNDACWKAGEPVPYYALAATLAACEDNSGRLAKTEYLANFLLSVNQLSPDDLLPAGTPYLPRNLLSFYKFSFSAFISKPVICSL